MRNRRQSGLIGFYDDPTQTEPTYDPSARCQCIVCNRQLTPPMKTISLMLRGGKRSLFFRVHAPCWENLSDDERATYESSVIDTEARREGRSP